MRQTTEQVIHNLIAEKNDLTSKITALEGFMICPDFMETTLAQKKLLEQQHAAMVQLKNIFIKRIFNLRVEVYEAQKEMEPQQEAPAVEPQQQVQYKQILYSEPCKSCGSYKGNGMCTGGPNGIVDHTGAMLCFSHKEEA